MGTSLKKVLVFLLITALLVWVALFLSGVFQKPTREAGPVSTPVSEKVELQGELVEGFPPIPAYQGARLVGSYKKLDDSKMGYEASWTTEDDVATVSKWYYESLPLIGWDVVEPPEDLEASGEQFMVFDKGGITLNLIIENEEGEETGIHVEFPVR